MEGIGLSWGGSPAGWAGGGGGGGGPFQHHRQAAGAVGVTGGRTGGGGGRGGRGGGGVGGGRLLGGEAEAVQPVRGELEEGSYGHGDGQIKADHHVEEHREARARQRRRYIVADQ